MIIWAGKGFLTAVIFPGAGRLAAFPDMDYAGEGKMQVLVGKNKNKEATLLAKNKNTRIRWLRATATYISM